MEQSSKQDIHPRDLASAIVTKVRRTSMWRTARTVFLKKKWRGSSVARISRIRD